MSKPTIEDYQKRLNSIFEDMFSCGIKLWKEGDNGDLMTVADWLSQVKNGGFIDYDGHGNFAMDRQDGHYISSHVMVKPSDISYWEIKVPRWATHVVWYNR